MNSVLKIRKKGFAIGVNFYKLVWIFLIGSLLGYVVETVYCSIADGHFESRAGLVLGVFKPIYGFGAVVYTLLLHKVRHYNVFVIFVLSMLIGAVFEIICSWFGECVLGVSYWEYSGYFLNIDGRTNLVFAACWGLLGTVFIKWMLPIIDRVIENIPCTLGVVLTWTIFLFLVFDMFLTGFAIWRCVDRNYNIEPRDSFESFLDSHFDDEFLHNLYPNMEIL